MTDATLNNMTADSLLTDESAAVLLGVESRTIRAWRTRRGLPYIRITSRVIRIRKADLDRWLAQHLVAITRGDL
jgi:excisionase family DNA binding protein